MLFTDAPIPSGAAVRAYNHVLGESRVLVFAPRDRARKLRRGFPRSLDGEPLVLPAAGTTLRRAIDQWLAERDLQPRVVAEIDDSALMKALGGGGIGLFPAPAIVADDVRRQFEVEPVGELDGVRERIYAISPERRITNPGVLAITRAARTALADPHAAR